MTTLTNPPIGPLLHRLFASAEQNDEKVMATWRAENAHRREQISSRQRADELSDAYLPISPEVGRLLYVLARSKQPRTIVEFGTSFGTSTIHLAAAVRDNRNNGRLITTELSAKKANRARQNVAEAGLSDIVEIREGDAFETLRGEVGEPIELLLLDSPFRQHRHRWRHRRNRCQREPNRHSDDLHQSQRQDRLCRGRRHRDASRHTCT
jgi:predicted O-methyltransferase YrrM